MLTELYQLGGDEPQDANLQAVGECMNNDGDRVIWTRNIDLAAQRRRWRTFRNTVIVPGVLLSIGAGLVRGWQEGLGGLFLLAMFGGLLAAWIWLLNFNERQNAELVLTADGHLKLGANPRSPVVPVADVRVWSSGETRATNFLANTRSHAHKSIDLAVVSFRFRSGSSVTEPVRFVWTSMPAAEIDGVREALSPHIAAPWVPLSELDD